MDVKFKVQSISKNVVRLVVDNGNPDHLKASGMPNYGQCELVIGDEKQLAVIEVGQEVYATMDFEEPEEETEAVKA